MIDMGGKFVITGGAGFIGSNLAGALATENEVVVIDDLSSGKIENLAGLDVKLVRGSVTDIELLRVAFAGAECVFHQAAVASVPKSVEDPIGTSRIGIEGTLNVLVAARDAGIDRIVYASSSAIYGDSDQLPKSEDMCPDPKSPYAVSKLAGERFCCVFNELYGMKNVALRYFNAYGPRQDPNSEYAAVIPRFISALLEGELPIIYGDGEQTRDFVYVMDVVRANILASNSRSVGVCNIASGESMSLNRLVGIMWKDAVMPIYAEPRPGDVRHSLADISKAEKIGYMPAYTMEEGLRDTIRWFSER